MPRPHTYATDAVVLRRSDFGEDGRLVTLLTPELGKKSAIAKGARRPTSKLGSHLEPFTQCRLFVAVGRNLDLITSATTIESYSTLRADLLAATAAWYAVELVDRATEVGMDCLALYPLLVAYLARLNSGGLPDALVGFFSMRLVTALGYRLALDRCPSCGTATDAASGLFSAESGGLLCRPCASTVLDARPLTASMLSVLLLWQQGVYQTWEASPPPPHVAAGADSLLRDSVRSILEREPKSSRIFERFRAEEYAASLESGRAFT